MLNLCYECFNLKLIFIQLVDTDICIIEYGNSIFCLSEHYPMDASTVTGLIIYNVGYLQPIEVGLWAKRILFCWEVHNKNTVRRYLHLLPALGFPDFWFVQIVNSVVCPIFFKLRSSELIRRRAITTIEY